MKNILFVLILTLFFSSKIVAKDFTIQILHFSDLDGNDASILENVSHFSALVNAFKNDPVHGKNTLLLSSGDNLKPGPRFYAGKEKQLKEITGSNEPGNGDIALLNEMGIQASSIGIQDFAAGVSALQGAISGDGITTARFPHLAVNIDFSTEKNFDLGKNAEEVKNLFGKVAGYAVAIINNEKIGIIGVTDPYLKKLVNVGKLAIQPKDPEDVEQLALIIQDAVGKLEAEGVNKIILLARIQLNRVKILANSLTNIDIIIAAGADGKSSMGDNNDVLFLSEHSADKDFSENYPYTTHDEKGNPVLIVSVDGDYKYLGRLILSFDDNGRIRLDSLNPVINGAYASIEAVVKKVKGVPNPKVLEIRDALQTVIQKNYGYILGYSTVYLDGRRSKIRKEETNLGNLTADSMLWYASQLTRENIQIALQNSGGIRTDMGTSKFLDGFSEAVLLPPYAYRGTKILEGGITEGHIRATLTYDNGLVVLTVTASELKDLLESGVSASGPGLTAGRFPQIAGMRFSFDTTKTPKSEFGNGQRIQTLEIVNRNGRILGPVINLAK